MKVLGPMVILVGILLVVFGTLLTWTPLGFGRLPGDILVKKGNVTFYFPLATSILISIVLTLVFWVLGVMKDYRDGHGS